MGDQERYRQLPSVDEVLSKIGETNGTYPHDLLVGEIRRTLDEMRAEIRAGRPAEFRVEERVQRSMESLAKPALRKVINATGVVLHTNLGRAPLPRQEPVYGYTNLEYDLSSGKRGRRDVHTDGLLERLLGQPGLVVNNNAAAVFLALHELASGYEVVISRGELIEIGDGFRIPDLMARSGAILKEVGTTNRTCIDDYRAAINDRTRLILRVHASNFRMLGFTSRPGVKEMAALGREREIIVYEDLGSGCLVDLRPHGIDEPGVRASLNAGVDLVSFSGDKLLGGPQAGILAGRRDILERLRRNPVFRALRVDKLICQSLETTLRNYLFERLDQIPALRMISQSAEELGRRAGNMAARLSGLDLEVRRGLSAIGGGATPEQPLPTWLIAIHSADLVAYERRLRLGRPPVVARIENGRLMIDLRTVLPEEESDLIEALLAAA